MEIRKYLIKSGNYRNTIKKLFILSLFLTAFMRYNKNEPFTESEKKCEKKEKMEQLKLFCEENRCVLLEMEESERKYFIKRIFFLSLFLSVFMRYNRSELFVESNQKCEKITKIEQLQLFCEKNQCTLMETEESER